VLDATALPAGRAQGHEKLSDLTYADLVIDDFHSFNVSNGSFYLSFQRLVLDDSGQGNLTVQHGSSDTQALERRIFAQPFINRQLNGRVAVARSGR